MPGWGGPYRSTQADAERLAERLGGKAVRAPGSIAIGREYVPAYWVLVAFRARPDVAVYAQWAALESAWGSEGYPGGSP